MRGWLAPLAAALCVVALVLGVHYAVNGGGGGPGPGPDGRRDDVEALLPEPSDLPAGDYQLTGYRSVARQLTLTYRLRNCENGVGYRVQAVAAESFDSVSVRLQRVLTGGADTPCSRDVAVRRISVSLQQPLTYRVVLDGAHRNRTVPRLE